MPLLLLIVAAGIGAHFIRKKVGASSGSPAAQTAGTSGPPRLGVVSLEGNLPMALREEVLIALAQERDADAIDAFGASIGKAYPRAAYELRCKAWTLRNRRGEFPVFGQDARRDPRQGKDAA